jgi:hypothetical protein
MLAAGFGVTAVSWMVAAGVTLVAAAVPVPSDEQPVEQLPRVTWMESFA